MPRTLLLMLLTLLVVLTLAPLTAVPVAADPNSPPPLPRGCGRGSANADATVDDYATAICCVSGYVYLNGTPIANADVTLTLDGQTVTVQTRTEFGSDKPYYFARLDSLDWLNAQPGDEITITARANGQTVTDTFTAHEGGQQIDMVLQQQTLSAEWVTGEALVPPAYDHAAVYDPHRQRGVLFGGETNNEFVNELWEWDGTMWMQRPTPAALSPRSHAALAYDEQRRVLVLFGGYNRWDPPRSTRAKPVLINETWEWDGTDWIQRTPATTPALRYVAKMVYDHNRQTSLLVGIDDTNPTVLATWEWDGTDWTQRTPDTPPPAREYFAMAYDTQRNRTVLHGGNADGNRVGDTWEWDGTNWQRMFPAVTPGIRSGHAMTYDPDRQRVLLTGGMSRTGGPEASMWAWDGSNWTQLPLDAPPRGDAAFFYDQQHQSIVLHGGYSIYYSTHPNETWVLNDDEWLQYAPRAKPPYFSNPYTHAYDSQRARIVRKVEEETWEWDGRAWMLRDNRDDHDRSNGFSDTAIVYDEARQQTLMFGGAYSTNRERSDETWSWNGQVWTKLQPPNSPPARRSGKLVYDAVNQRVMLSEGFSENDGRLNDLWEWNGSTWLERTVPRANYAPFVLGHDAQRNRLLAFYTGNGLATDTWTWDGLQWSRQMPATVPKDFTRRMVFDPNLQQLVFLPSLYNSGTPEYFQHMWTWLGNDWEAIQLTNTPYISSDHNHAHDLIVDTNRNRVVLLTGTGDMWEWDGTTWMERFPHDDYQPGALRDGAMSYIADGRTLHFGGWFVDGRYETRTYLWQGSRWYPVETPVAPAPRSRHRMASNEAAASVLLFGGEDADGAFLNDTWLWHDDGWQQHTPTTTPPPRADHTLTYDTVRDEWLLFGGVNEQGYLPDFWVYDGTNWQQRTPATLPPARAGATLTYDATRSVAVLVGGVNTLGLRSDIWEWDGTTWRDVTPPSSITPRSGHGAAYDVQQGVVVVVGGLGSTSALRDTWEWDGTSWRERLPTTLLPARHHFAATYDTLRGEFLAFGGQAYTGTVYDDMYRQTTDGTLSKPIPIATINRLFPRDARQTHNDILFEGSGADPDASNQITAYRWSYRTAQGQTVLVSDQPAFTKPASELPVGELTIRLEVQDNEGDWSRPVEETIFIRTADGRTSEQPTWTLLIYAAADNNLNPWMGTNPDIRGMLHRLERAGVQNRVNVAVLYDGPGSNDTRRYILSSGGQWTQQPLQEARMDEMATLRDFVTWGYDAFPNSDHYVLSLVDHANGVVGFAEDRSSPAPDGKPFLTPLEIRSALEQATDDGARKLDVLHYDGCSFGLYETAAIADGLAHYVIASPTTAWGIFAYERYRAAAGSAEDPRGYTLAVANTYAQNIAEQGLAYTIAVYDMAQFTHLRARISAFGDSLLAYVNGAPSTRRAEVRAIRDAAQKYDSGGLRDVDLDIEDTYVDVIDFATQVRDTLNDTAVDTAATNLIAAVEGNGATDPFVIFEQSGTRDYRGYDPKTQGDVVFTVNLDNAHGIGLFYPPRSTTNPNSAYVTYIEHRLFHVTRDSGWTRFLASALPPQLSGDAQPMPSDELIVPLIPESAAATPTATATGTPATATPTGTSATPTGTSATPTGTPATPTPTATGTGTARPAPGQVERVYLPAIHP